MKRILIIGGGLIVALLSILIGLGHEVSTPVITSPSHRGYLLRREIFSALDNASSMRVIEHSCRWDSTETMNDPNFKETIYATVTLDREHIESLRKALPQALDYGDTQFRACIFEEHHRIEIVQGDGRTFILRICFHCGELEVNDGEQRIMPEGWDGSLRTFFVSLGLRPDGPWKQ